jgi:hypothetical protein
MKLLSTDHRVATASGGRKPNNMDHNLYFSGRFSSPLLPCNT